MNAGVFLDSGGFGEKVYSQLYSHFPAERVESGRELKRSQVCNFSVLGGAASNRNDNPLHPFTSSRIGRSTISALLTYHARKPIRIMSTEGFDTAQICLNGA